MTISTPNAAVDAVYRNEWGRIVATLIRSFGDFDVAEEAAQDAFAAALKQWPADGIPVVARSVGYSNGQTQSNRSSAPPVSLP